MDPVPLSSPALRTLALAVEQQALLASLSRSGTGSAVPGDPLLTQTRQAPSTTNAANGAGNTPVRKALALPATLVRQGVPEATLESALNAGLEIDGNPLFTQTLASLSWSMAQRPAWREETSSRSIVDSHLPREGGRPGQPLPVASPSHTNDIMANHRGSASAEASFGSPGPLKEVASAGGRAIEQGHASSGPVAPAISPAWFRDELRAPSQHIAEPMQGQVPRVEPRMAPGASRHGGSPAANSPTADQALSPVRAVIPPEAIASATGAAAIRDTRPLVVLSETAARELDLTPGQTVLGLVAADANGLRLIFDGHAIELPQQSGAWQAGQAVRLRVTRGTSGYELYPQAAPAPTGTGTPPMSMTLEQGPLGALLLLLRPHAGEALDRLLRLGMLERWLAPSLIDQRSRPGGPHPTWRSADPQAVRRVIQGQLVSTESTVAANQTPSPADLRASLRASLSRERLDETTADYLREGIADLDASQYQAAQAQMRGELHWTIHLPFADRQPVHLTIRRPASSREQPRPALTIDMHTEHPALGDLWIRAGLNDPSLVDLSVWATRLPVAAAARQHIPVLVSELQRFGLRTGKLEIFDGPRPGMSDSPPEPPPGTLINLEA